MAERKIGTITHYFSNIGVGIILLDSQLNVGEKIRIKGNTTDYEQTVGELQHDHKNIEAGDPGQEVGIKVADVVRDGDEVYLVE